MGMVGVGCILLFALGNCALCGVAGLLSYVKEHRYLGRPFCTMVSASPGPYKSTEHGLTTQVSMIN